MIRYAFIAVAVAVGALLVAATGTHDATDELSADGAARAAAPSPAAARAEAPELAEMPEVDRGQVEHVFRLARDRGSETPGTDAFRAHADRFVEHNRELAEQHARREGLTPREIAELTFFALLARQSQDWPAVERLVGAPVDGDTRAQMADLMRSDSAEMKGALRGHVAAGDPLHVRLETIERVERHYLAEYYRATGMDRDKLDQLLAGVVLGDVVVGADDGPAADETALAEDAVERAQPRMVYLERVVPPRGRALSALKAAARDNPRFAAELERDLD